MTTDGNESTCMLIIVTLFILQVCFQVYICFQVCLFTRDRGLLGYNIYIYIYILIYIYNIIIYI